MKRKKILILVSVFIATVLLVGGSLYLYTSANEPEDYEKSSTAGISYSDVPESHQAYESIKRLAGSGIFGDEFLRTSEENFGAEEKIRPYELLYALYELAGEPEIAPTKPEIVLDEEHRDKWYSDAVLWAAYAGIADHSGSEMHWKVFKGFVSDSDVLVALYKTAKIMGIDTTDAENNGDLERFRNMQDYTRKVLVINGQCGTGTATTDSAMGEAIDSETVLFTTLRWAVGAGLIEGYPYEDPFTGEKFELLDVRYEQWDWDRSVPYLDASSSTASSSDDFSSGSDNEQDSYASRYTYESFVLSRADLAVMLDRFMDYAESVR